MSSKSLLMVDTDWDLISNDSELSDLYWPESESDGEENEGYDSALESGNRDNGSEEESGGSDSDFSTLLADESEAETETSEDEEGSEEEEAAFAGGALMEGIVDESDTASCDETTQVGEEDEGTENEGQDTDDEYGEPEILVGSHASIDSIALASTMPLHNAPPGVAVHFEDEEPSPPLMEKSALEKLDNELEETVKRCKTVIHPLIAEVHLLAVSEDPSEHRKKFKRLEEQYRPLVIDLSVPLETRKKIVTLLNVLRDTIEAIPKPEASKCPDDTSLTNEHFIKSASDDKGCYWDSITREEKDYDAEAAYYNKFALQKLHQPYGRGNYSTCRTVDPFEDSAGGGMYRDYPPSWQSRGNCRRTDPTLENYPRGRRPFDSPKAQPNVDGHPLPMSISEQQQRLQHFYNRLGRDQDLRSTVEQIGSVQHLRHDPPPHSTRDELWPQIKNYLEKRYIGPLYETRSKQELS